VPGAAARGRRRPPARTFLKIIVNPRAARGQSALSELVRLVDQLEAEAPGYVRLEQVQDLLDAALVEAAIAEDVLLLDERLALDAASGELAPTTLCRLNRRHQAVRALLSW
jgi:hypothetical protein